MKIAIIECGIIERYGKEIEVHETYLDVVRETKKSYVLENGERVWKKNMGITIDGFRRPFNNGTGYVLNKKIYLNTESKKEIEEFKQKSVSFVKGYLEELVSRMEKAYENAMEVKKNLENM